MPTSSAPPVIGIVVPLFKHSVLVAEALRSAIHQDSRFPYVIVVVNDGCPYRESDLQVKSMVTAHPELIRYVFRTNGGLSAARNTGIDYLLQRFPSVQAIFFLDADNALQPKALETTYQTLIEHREAAWVYPNIDMFGIARNFDYGGAYYVSKHLLFNICEAGSLVDRRVFEAGIRFDESMKLGYEDWEFWLNACRHGFRGRHEPRSGFLYRNRAESMLAQSKRDNTEILSYMRRKHRSLLSEKSLLSRAALELPRFAIVCLDTDTVTITSGSHSAMTSMSWQDFEMQFWSSVIAPSWRHSPPIMLFTTRSSFDELQRQGLILWALYNSEVTLQDSNFAGLAMERGSASAVEVRPGGGSRECGVIALKRELFCAIIDDDGTNWVEQIQFAPHEIKLQVKTLTLPQHGDFTPAPSGVLSLSFLLRIYALRTSSYREAARRRWIWRDTSVPPCHALWHHVREVFRGQVIYPFTPAGERNIGFVVPIASFGGVERVGYQLARQFGKAGWRAHLFVIGRPRIDLPNDLNEVMTSINFLEADNPHLWDAAAEFQGTALPDTQTDPGGADRIVAALGWLDAVVNCQCGPLNGAAAALRRLGVKTATHVHLLDLSPLGRPVGHPFIALAYEHAYDLVLCTSRRLTAWMHAAGVPAEKLLHVANGPGYGVATAERERILAQRSLSRQDSLNVLYFGRLDRQKGIDRVAAVMEEALRRDLALEWRIVGSSVTDQHPVPDIILDRLEPAAFATHDLIALMSWADVMVLLSDYEGVPLSILEAQQLGVVVIATDVGSVSEIITHGETGLLVRPETAVEQTVAVLDLLRREPALRARISAAAAAPVMDWERSAAELIRRLTESVDAERRRAA